MSHKVIYEDKEYYLGYIPKFDDKKDLRSKWKSISRKIKNSIQTLPKEVDISFGDIYNQGNYGSCIFNALSYSINARKHYINIKNKDYPTVLPSRFYLYSNYRIMNNIPLTTDSGGDYTGAFKAIDTYKYVKEQTWPYIDRNFSNQIPKSIYDLAKKINYPKVQRTLMDNLTSVDQIKYPLSKNKPVVYAQAIYSSFWNINSDNSIMPRPDTNNEKLDGYHALTLCGYSDTKKLFKVVNSWGNQYGDNGCFYIPYDLILDSNIFFGFYSIDSA